MIDFTQSEWQAAIAEIQASTAGDSELTDAELTAVSGGITIGGCFPPKQLPSDRIQWSDSWQNEPKSTYALARGVI
ncbi:hypothetical protein H6G97_11310 [Nostoc flagelliforme FACHB-838]|uniref:Bacteriocin n=1 Tax=Nostoc flagelliforme FACHB-838 TaxID=2692904 RepID=A0ABR8DMH1_9NOSO|nr:hypothetical protein [Nostoc flagelliforme]MBD2530126.1 hypothetical protein [Nostoc flagelliforme FACHB-838]